MKPNSVTRILCLALAYHLGARSATAQAPGNPVVAYGAATGGAATGSYNVAAITASGDLYGAQYVDTPWHFIQNIFGSATPATQATWGQVKARYRPGAAAAPHDK